MPLFFGRPRPVPAVSTHLLPLIVLLLAVFACYANSLSNGFVMDDYYIIQLNRDTFTLKSIVTAFTSPDYLVNAQPTPYYRPLNRLSYILEQEFFGVNPLGYHAVSIALHGLGVVLLYLVLFSLGCARLPALAAALLFGVHPVNAEAVNFIAARNNILASVFVLGSYLALLHAEETRGWRGYLLSGFLFFLGVLSKETAVMFLPFIFVVRTLRPGAADRRILLKAETGYLLPYLGFLVLYAVLRTMALDQTPNLAGLSQRIWKLVYIVPRYFSQVVFPNDLSVHYIVPDNLATIAVPLLAGWVVMAATLCCLLRVRTPAIEFGLAWLALNFLPISTIVPIPSTPMADRYLYLPLIGVAVIVADRLHHLGRRQPAGRLATVGVAAALLSLSLLTVCRNTDWHDDLTVARAMVRANPADPVGRFELGYEYLLRGERGVAQRELATAVSLAPRTANAAWAGYYLATGSLEQHEYRQAEGFLEQAAKTDSSKAAIHYLLGSLYYRNMRPAEGRREYRLFLQTFLPDTFHLVPEVSSALLEPTTVPAGTVRLAAAPPAEFRLYQRLASGTELYFDPGSVRNEGDLTTVATRHILTKQDRQPYYLRFVRYHLTSAAEVRHDFALNCREHLYKTLRCEFRDRGGNVLADIDVEKEDHNRFAYSLTGTPMATLFGEVCGRQ